MEISLENLYLNIWVKRVKCHIVSKLGTDKLGCCFGSIFLYLLLLLLITT